jgi:hypothetical protein
MLYAGLDLSRKRLDFHLLDAEGATVEVGASRPDADGLGGLNERLARQGAPIRAAIESMNGARFVHDRLGLAGWQVEIADSPVLLAHGGSMHPRRSMILDTRRRPNLLVVAVRRRKSAGRHSS